MDTIESENWRKPLGLRQKQAGNALGLPTATLDPYERGGRRETDEPVPMAHLVGLACLGLS
ncbi:transcriptional regulator [Rhodospirillum rubrum]|uniref:transcriptional regulator n=1 Tax=Rhodospirillum rubrum TaxID=1085 RepID=UPI001904157D|nr:transcriptional regulator [Rhodospirillum rubrum]